MRLKEIKPGMVIHCKTKGEVSEILKVVKENGFSIDIWDRKKENTCLRISDGVLVGFDCVDYYINDGYTITEFSDLIIPELSAKEVLETISEICSENRCGACLFNTRYGCLANRYDYKKVSDDIIAICTKWREEHPKEEEKKVEVEQFWEIKCLEDPSYHTTEHYKDEAEALRMCVILAEKDPKNSYYAVFVAKAKE